MSQGQRPQGLKLRKVQSQQRSQDIGSLHVLDYWLHYATRDCFALANRKIHPQGIGRYLDGEEEREGTYR